VLCVFILNVLARVLQDRFVRTEILMLFSFVNYISFNFAGVILQGGALV